MTSNHDNPIDPSAPASAALSENELQRLQHLCEELDVQFDLQSLSVAEAKQLIGELEKRAARESQNDDANV